LKGLFPPRAGEQVIGALAGREEVHRDDRELLARAALKQQHVVRVGHAEKLSDERRRFAVHAFVSLTAVAVLDDAHAGAGEIEQLALSSLERLERQRRGPRVEIHSSGHGVSKMVIKNCNRLMSMTPWVKPPAARA